MNRVAAILVVASCVSNSALGQERETLKERCETIILESAQGAVAFNTASPWQVRLLRRVPAAKSEQLLIKYLEHQDPNVCLSAAEVLIDRDSGQVAARVQAALEQLETPEREALVTKTRLQAMLGDESAAHQLKAWSDAAISPLGFLPGLGSKKWICPMMCAPPADGNGKCPVCGMELVQGVGPPTLNDAAFDLAVLEARQKLGAKVGDAARKILASDAEAWVRLRAAALWANEDAAAALPHVRVFLDSPHRGAAVAVLAEIAPKESVEDFERVLKNSPNAVVKCDALRGRLRCDGWMGAPCREDARSKRLRRRKHRGSRRGSTTNC